MTVIARDTAAKARGRAGSGAKTNGGKRRTGKKQGVSSQSSFDAFKEFEGKRYTGMKVGRGHKWRYDEGDWTERKITPEKWEIRFTTVKRRRGHAPEGSGVPVGTEYHWYVLADQTVKKLDANNYSTDMVGHKYKLAHKRADKSTWSASERAQRTHLVKILKQMLADLDGDALPAQPPSADAKRANGKKKRSNGAKKARHLAAA